MIQNWVKLEPGKPVTLHFKDHVVTSRQIMDPTFKVPRTLQSLVFLVDEVDGAPVDMTFSVVSEALAEEFRPYLEGKAYRAYNWRLVKEGPAWAAPTVTRLPR